MTKLTKQLEQELRQAGASADEGQKLAALAVSLGRLKGMEPQRVTLPSLRTKRWHWFAPFGLATLASLAFGFGLVATAQTANPGTLLYPVKQASETVAIKIQPDYRGVVMMRRAQEVKQLVAHGDNRLAAITLADYKVEMARYKVNNYAALQYCKTNLEQAAAMSSGPVHEEITATLASFKSDLD